MSRIGVIAALVIAALAVVAIRMAGTGSTPAAAGASSEDSAAKAYDYQVRNVKVQQMGPDGSLQYELEAQQITQQPDNGRISVQDLVMHHDPAGDSPDGANRWTLTAQHADLPEAGTAIDLQGKVRAQGRPQNSRALVSVATEQLTYNLQTQDISTRKPIEITFGSSSFHSDDLLLNIKTGDMKVDSEVHGTHSP